MTDAPRRPRWTVRVALLSAALVAVLAFLVAWGRAGWAFDPGQVVTGLVVGFLWLVLAMLPPVLRRLDRAG